MTKRIKGKTPKMNLFEKIYDYKWNVKIYRPEEIARELGLNINTVYARFNSKYKLQKWGVRVYQKDHNIFVRGVEDLDIWINAKKNADIHLRQKNNK